MIIKFTTCEWIEIIGNITKSIEQEGTVPWPHHRPLLEEVEIRIYLFELRDCHRYNSGIQSASQQELNQGEVVLLHDEKNHRTFCKLARIEKLLSGSDNRIRGAVI